MCWYLNEYFQKMSIWLYSGSRLAFFIRSVTSNQPNLANSMPLTHKWVNLQDILSCITMHRPQRHIWKKDIKPNLIFNLDSRDEWSMSQLLYPITHWIGGKVSPREHLDVLEKRKVSFPCLELNGSSSPKHSHYADWATKTLPTKVWN